MLSDIEAMNKGVRIHIDNKNHMNGIFVCSECLCQVDYLDKFCNQCGAILEPLSVGKDLENVISQREAYKQAEKTGWEKEE